MPVDKEWLKRAADIVGPDGILTDASDLEAYGHDEYALEIYVQPPKACSSHHRRSRSPVS